MATQEKIQIDYLHDKVYDNEKLNEIGATTNLTLRTVTAHNNTNCKYVRKFGADFACNDITNAVIVTPRSAGGNAWTYDFQGWNGSAWVSMGSVADTGGASAAFVDGAEFAATKVKIVVTPDAGDTISITNNDTITLTVDGATLTIALSGESTTSEFTLYLSSTGSTYYDEDYMYGGARRTPTGTEQLPYFTITAALAALGGAFTIVTVLDSATYDEELTISGAYTLQAALGQTPTITDGCGARVTREVVHDGNNSDTAYVSKTGNDTTGNGNYQNPYLTYTQANTSIGGRTYINIMDSETYSEAALSITGGITIEPIYGQIPTFQYLSGSYILNLHHVNSCVQGIIFDGLVNYIYLLDIDAILTKNINNNNFINTTHYCIYLNEDSSNLISKNRFTNFYRGIYFYVNSFTTAPSITKNYFYTSIASGGCISFSGQSMAGNVTGEINNNVFDISNGHCINLSSNNANMTYDVNINNNLFYSRYTPGYTTSYGLRLYEQPARSITFIGDVNYNIFYNLAIGIEYYCDVTINYTCFYNNAVDTVNHGSILTNNNPITTNPKIIDITNYYYGISSDSSCYKTNGSEADVGVIIGNILISSNTVTINGFIFDGQTFCHNAIYKTGATDYTALTVKWCTIKDYVGIAIDDYSGATTTSTITNNLIYSNGDGSKHPQSENTITYNCYYNNIAYNLYFDYTQTVNHNVFYGGQYGLYTGANASASIIKNSIFDYNSLYSIYAAATIGIYYSCITGAINSFVTIIPATTYYNITDNPIFVSVNSGSEDFNIKTLELGYVIDSTCKDAADDGYDIGAYLILRTISSDGWKEHLFSDNPKQIDESYNNINKINFESSLGATDFWMKGTKRLFSLKFGNMQYMYEADRKMLFYFAGLHKSRENSIAKEKARLRVHFLPSQKEDTGTAGVVDATEKTLTDATQSWYPDEHKGFYCSIKSTSGTNSMSTVGATNVCTVAAATWTPDAYIGYYLCIYTNTKIHYFYILDNDATTLTCSDPYGYLDDQTNISWSIVKNYLIEKNDETILYLQDDDAELVSGSSKSYHIDFIICNANNDSINYMQPRYYRQQETWKMGSELNLLQE